jgi:hypothetical protein
MRKIAWLGDNLPRQCGIAMFTFDLLSAVWRDCLCAQTGSWAGREKER